MRATDSTAAMGSTEATACTAVVVVACPVASQLTCLRCCSRVWAVEEWAAAVECRLGLGAVCLDEGGGDAHRGTTQHHHAQLSSTDSANMHWQGIKKHSSVCCINIVFTVVVNE